MDISKLDEWQGVTPQLVTDWLLKNGWMQTKPRWWERGEDAFTFDSATFDQLWFWTHALAAIYTNGNVQALIREINPRMRKGVPSKAALRAHRGLWLRSVGIETIATVLSRLIEEFPSPRDDESFFWPCDDNGNKTRWPTDAEGNML